MQKVTGIILAGGKSRRMGAEKGLLRLGDKYMIEYAIEALKPFCNQILISENTDAYDFLGYKVIPDIYPNSGPMGGIYSALKYSENEINFVLSCDMPFINSDLIESLIIASKNSQIAVPWHGERKFEPMCAVYKKSVIPTLEEFIGVKNYRIPDVYEVVPTNKLRMDDSVKGYNIHVFENVNSATEFVNASELLKVDLPEMDNLLLIAGSGRNVGKTSLACKLIEAQSKLTDVVGIKISPHLHEQQNADTIIFIEKGFAIYEEFDVEGEKDSSRMLRAGAKQVYYIQTDEHKVGEAFNKLKRLIPNIPIVCESGGLGNYYKPGLFLMCHLKDREITKEKSLILLPKIDQTIHFNNDEFEFDLSTIKFEENKWGISS